MFNLDFLKKFIQNKRIKDLEDKVSQLLEDKVKEKEVKPIVNEKPYKKLIHNAGQKSLVIILHDDDVIFANDDFLQQIREAKSELEVRAILNLQSFVDEEQKALDLEEIKQEEEVKETVNSLLDIFKGNEDYTVVGESVYLKGVASIEIPKDVVGAIIEALIKIKEGNTEEVETFKQKYESLKYFTAFLLLNPIENAKRDCLKFVKKNNIPITSNGLLVCYRRVVSVKEEKDYKLANFVSEQYLKVKKNKKSPKNYSIFKCSNEEPSEKEYVLATSINSPAVQAFSSIEQVGCLYHLYSNLNQLQDEIHYTDSHTRTKTIKLGEVYREDEDKIDLNNQRDCSSGLHVGSKSFGFGSFGNVGVIALVNPSKVRSVPVSDAHKMRVSEMFIAGVAEKETYDEIVDNQEFLDFSEEYFNESLSDLQDALLKKSLQSYSCKSNEVKIEVKEAENLSEILKSRIVKV